MPENDMPESTAQPPHPSAYGPSGDRSSQNGAEASSARFFGWLRGLGIVRQNGWAGGVCGGVAGRFGIDPIIVRGIAVVVAILGGPAFLLYAAAWLLLPDTSGDIHLERLFKGHFEPAMIGIIVLALFSFVPFAQGFWWAGAQFWGGLSWFASLGRVLWSLLIIGLIVAFVIWAARSGRVRAQQPTPYGAPAAPFTTAQASAQQASAEQTSPTDAGGGAASSASAGAAPASTLPDPASGTAPDATASQNAATSGSGEQYATDQGGVADWRARQDAWRAEYAAWNAQQADARAFDQQRAAEARAQAQARTAEIREQARALSAEAEAARRRRKAANPRTSAAYVGIALGIALVLGGLGAAIALGSSASDYSVPIGLAVATATVGGSIVLAGALRRRSGFLGFVSILLIVACLVTVLPPRGKDLAAVDAYYLDPAAVSVFQPVGSARVTYDVANAHGHVDISQGVGSTEIDLVDGLAARVVITQRVGRSSVNADRMDGDGNAEPVFPRVATHDGQRTSTFVIGHGAPTVTIRIDQEVGSVYLAQRASL